MSSPDKKIILVIPAFNEGESIGRVVFLAKSKVSEVVVVDDGSTDQTAELARDAGALVLRHEENLGYDMSLNDGFREASKRADIIVTFDADDQHKAEDITKLVQPIVDGTADLVLSERPNLTHWGEKIFSWYTRFRFGIKDPLSGLKAYHVRVYKEIGYFDTIGSIGTQLVFEAIRRGFTFKIIPITVNTRLGTSRFYHKDFLANLKIIEAMIKIAVNL